VNARDPLQAGTGARSESHVQGVTTGLYYITNFATDQEALQAAQKARLVPIRKLLRDD
jgi:hypothetical protein